MQATAPNPLPRGARVALIAPRSGETLTAGALGRVTDAIGPAAPDSGAPGTYGYFVIWDALPGVKTFVAGSRLRVREEAATAAG